VTVHPIWAEARDRVIGADGRIPWRIPGEQAMFKERTMGATVVMGRGTWDSLPRKPLPGRENVVLTRDPSWAASGAAVVHGVDEVPVAEEVWVIGGAEVYTAFLPKAGHVVRTRIDMEVLGDTRAPELGPEWVVTESSGRTTPDGLRYVVEELIRS
jgi:dihydrofolate reductase